MNVDSSYFGERLREPKGITLCEEGHIKLHYGHDSAQITNGKSPSIKRELTICVCLHSGPCLLENLLHKIGMLIFIFHFLGNPNSIREVGFGPKIKFFFYNSISL